MGARYRWFILIDGIDSPVKFEWGREALQFKKKLKENGIDSELYSMSKYDVIIRGFQQG